MNGKIGLIPPQLGEFKVVRDNNDGGIVFSIGAASVKVAPHEAIKLSVTIMKACGCNVQFNPISGIVKPAPAILK